MPDTTTYSGGCHCGAVRYDVTTDLSRVIECNCSLCHKRGYVLAFVPADQFTLHSGEERLTDYQFNKKIIHHLFCSTCGVASFGRGVGHDGSPMVAVNVRCLDGVDLSTLTITPYNGKDR
jgi:hypothetical protein